MEVKPAKRNKLTLYIGIALVAGIIAGFILNKYYVGIENTKIANAEVQSKNLHQRMKGYETVKDSTAFTSLLSLQKKILQQITFCLLFLLRYFFLQAGQIIKSCAVFHRFISLHPLM